jgi:hypothetical protein
VNAYEEIVRAEREAERRFERPEFGAVETDGVRVPIVSKHAIQTEPDYTDHVVGAHARRRAAIAEFGFAVPTERALGALAGLGPIVEVGASGGEWARLLHDRGVDVLATDADPSGTGVGMDGTRVWTEVAEGDAAEVAAAHPDRALLVIWPHYDEDWPGLALAAYEGDVVAYVGEGRHGCTGDERFHDLLEEWGEPEVVALPTWPGVHDNLYIYRRRRDDAEA